MNYSPKKQAFSFIEVMVALVILSMSLIILMESQARSINLVSRARLIDDAVTLASAKLTELTQMATEKGVSALKQEESGDFDHDRYPGYRWKYRILSVPSPDFATLMGAGAEAGADEEKSGKASNASLFAGPLQMITKIWGEAVKEIHLEVIWTDGSKEKSYELVTHLISQDAAGKIQGFVGALTGGAK